MTELTQFDSHFRTHLLTAKTGDAQIRIHFGQTIEHLEDGIGTKPTSKNVYWPAMMTCFKLPDI